MDESKPKAAVARDSGGRSVDQEVVTSGGVSAVLGSGNQFNVFPDAGDASVAPVSIAPPLGQRDDGFPLRGRDELVNSMLDAILSRDSRPRVHILNGLGGCGKTSVALEIAAHARMRNVETWWISAATRDRFIESMYALCRRVGVPSDDLRYGDSPDILWNLLNDLKRPWLLIIDNADDPTVMEVGGRKLNSGTGWLRPVMSPYGAVVVTSRDASKAHWGSWCVHHEVKVLPPNEAARVLIDYVGKKAGSYEEAADLAVRLGGLPLALRLAGLYLADAISVPSAFVDDDLFSTFTQYRAAVEQGRFDEVFRVPSLADDEARILVTRTWEISLDLLHRRGLPEARLMLRLLSSLADTPIPYTALLHARSLAESQSFSGMSGRRVWEILQALDTFGLIDLDRAGADGTSNAPAILRVHTLVRAISRHQNEESDQSSAYLRLATTLVHRVVKDLENEARNPRGWRQWSTLCPHVSYLLRCVHILDTDVVEQFPDILQMAVGSADASLEYLHARGLYEQAEIEGRAVVEAKSKFLGEEHPNTLKTKHQLGHMLNARGKLEEAEAEHRAVLETQSRVLGEEHEHTLATRHCFGHMLDARGKLEEAEVEHRAVLEAESRILGEEHPNTLTTRHCLAGLLQEHGHLEAAEVEYRAVLDLRGRVLGGEHPSRLETWHKLGHVLDARGKLEEAEAEHRAVVKAESRVFGEEHPSTLGARYCLAGLLQRRGQLEVAEVEYRAVLEAESRVLGEEHPRTLATRYQLADLFQERGQLEVAEVEYRAVLEAESRVLGEEHPSTLSTRYQLADLLQERGELEAAEVECRAVLDLRGRVLGEEHPSTLATRHKLGHVLDARGKLEAAEAEHRAVLDLRGRVLGEEHPNTLAARNCLAGLLQRRGELEAAEVECRSVLEAESRVLGEEHPSTLATRHQLGHLLDARGKLEEAEVEHRAVLEAESRVLGEEHPSTLDSRNCLAGLLQRRGELKAAEVECRSVLEAESRVLGEQHPNTLTTRHQLADLLKERGQLEAAEVEYRAVLNSRRRVLGEEHPETLNAQAALQSLQKGA